MLYLGCEIQNFLCVLILFSLFVLLLKLAEVIYNLVLSLCLCSYLHSSFNDYCRLYSFYFVGADLNEIRPILPQLLDGMWMSKFCCLILYYNYLPTSLTKLISI